MHILPAVFCISSVVPALVFQNLLQTGVGLLHVLAGDGIPVVIARLQIQLAQPLGRAEKPVCPASSRISREVLALRISKPRFCISSKYLR